MRSSSGGLFTTLLMFVPLIAVPALAIFGVPNGDPLSASPDGEATAPPGDLVSLAKSVPAAAGGLKSSPAEVESLGGEGFLPAGSGTLGEGGSDPFLQPAGRSPGAGRPSAIRRDAAPLSATESNPFRDDALGTLPRASRSGSSDGRATSPGKPVRVAAGELSAAAGNLSGAVRLAAAGSNEIPFGTPVDPTDKTATPADWPSAVQRLKDLGIRDYQLVPGERENSFLFLCDYAAPENPRIVHRFEAEAGDPLQAVQDVLQQVERWLDRR